ncbi:MurR/RpiR family transcriptional regulator [Geobacillus stearothermophilus]|nr:MurR/RpiR family transcriptional regulator [Geobacillus stearothermophilus]
MKRWTEREKKMNELGLLAKIKQQMERFSPAEKKVAAYILDHAELVPNMTTKDLAQAADTSEASVVRFVSFVASEERRSWHKE